MLAHSVVDDRAEHLFDPVRVKRPWRSRASDKQQVRISPQIYIAPIETVETRNHDHQPLAHATLEEFASNVVPLVQPEIDPPHLLQLSVGIFHLDGPRKFSQRLRHIISKQDYRLRRLPETAEELIDILKQTWKVTRSAQCLHIPLTISTR